MLLILTRIMQASSTAKATATVAIKTATTVPIALRKSGILFLAVLMAPLPVFGLMFPHLQGGVKL